MKTEYLNDLPSPNDFEQEVERWILRCNRSNLPESVTTLTETPPQPGQPVISQESCDAPLLPIENDRNSDNINFPVDYSNYRQSEITPGSSETDVKQWLKDEVGLNDDLLKKYDRVIEKEHGSDPVFYQSSNFDRSGRPTEINDKDPNILFRLNAMKKDNLEEKINNLKTKVIPNHKQEFETGNRPCSIDLLKNVTERFPVQGASESSKLPENNISDAKDKNLGDNKLNRSYPTSYKKQKSQQNIASSKREKKGIGIQQVETQTPRQFKGNSDFVVYQKGKILNQPENDGTLSKRCLEFKSFFNFENSSKESRLIKFQLEALKFACGCLNARRNGTIIFGVADSVNSTYKHGEIVGFEISEHEFDSKSKYTDALRDGISRCVSSEVVSIAGKCISNPKFVRVAVPDEKNYRYVIEVDVEPAELLCEKHYFKVNLKNIKNCSIKSVEDKYLIYVRKGSSTQSYKNENEQLFILKELQENLIERSVFEKEEKGEQENEFLATKLERLLTRGTFRFNRQNKQILVLSKPTDEQKLSEEWKQAMSFINFMQVTSVFDFDDYSNINGLCVLYQNKETCEFVEKCTFNDYAGNFQELAINLDLRCCENAMWIFANGRSDCNEDKPHLNRTDWHMHSAGICNAVSFLSQPFVIPTGGSIILVLLFSNDFNGLIDTFNEMTRKFGWEPLVIIAENKRVFEEFAETIQRECKGSIEQLEKVSVVGMLWEHVNCTIRSIMSYDAKINFSLSSSSGALVEVDEKFINDLCDLSILSATECKNRTLKNSEDRQQFGEDEELRFYEGNVVGWWNFFSQNHVCERYLFHALQERVQNLLYNANRDKQKNRNSGSKRRNGSQPSFVN
ncbi:sterile alpha motif domain-containing protein 9-like [Saccostrea cucullata]|uniref:sterile alpha motif domain-containing protein 9-like n=1 Tax=Saccostrea cuccullata TaxID=36930 RepID=UPI002ED0E14A